MEAAGSSGYLASASEPARAAVIVAHGLNNRPEAMDPIVACLSRHGFHALRLSLHDTGGGTREARRCASRSEALTSSWISEMARGYRELEARHPALPVYNLSFSLGALVTIRFLELEGGASFERMVFLAPAIALTRRAGLVRCLMPLQSLDLALPSVAPRAVRARDATPIAEYAAMLDLVGQARTIVRPRIGSIPTAVLASRRDEVVSFAGIESWLRRNRLERWTLTAIQPEAAPAACLSHEHLSALETVRQRPWSRLHAEILRHFGVSHPLGSWATDRPGVKSAHPPDGRRASR